jgi:hypothetical protein
MEAELASALAQFGAAGLIAWMWLTERRSAAERERQLTEAHRRIEQERPQLTTLLSVVQDNTRALTAIESGQRALAATLNTIAHPNTNAPARAGA